MEIVIVQKLNTKITAFAILKTKGTHTAKYVHNNYESVQGKSSHTVICIMTTWSSPSDCSEIQYNTVIALETHSR